jgi:hypothetical protein
MNRMRSFAAGGLLFVAAPAWAGESLINGQPLVYNQAYRCKGERVIVAHCRDEDDNSYCQVVYPDRPFVNGMQVAPVEKRGDVIARINACSQSASAAARTVAPGSVAKAPSSYAKTGKPPGLGKGSWLTLHADHSLAVFFTKARMKRTGNLGEGWFTTVYVRPMDLANTSIRNAQFTQSRYVANCAKGTQRFAEVAYFDPDSKFLGGAFIGQDVTQFAVPEQGSIGAMEFNVLCGKPVKLADATPLNGDGDFLRLFYLAWEGQQK